jgi:tripartite-type tricarboxylate transporter receptor subunit TctC
MLWDLAADRQESRLGPSHTAAAPWLPRRSLLATALAAPLLPLPASAQEFPTRPIRIIVPYVAGGVVDGLARVLAPAMRDALGQPIVVENRPGAGSVIGMQACAAAPPDGHTICMTVQDSLSYNPHLMASLPYDAERSFTPITNLGWNNGAIVVNARTGITDFAGLIAAARARSGGLNWGTWGPASSPDILMRGVARATSVGFTAVSYGGAGQMYPALLAGELDVSYMGVGGARPHVEAGRLRPLALTGRQRHDAMPGVPTLAELGVDLGLPFYMAAYGPAGLPEPVLARLHAALVQAAGSPAAHQFYRAFTMTFVGDSPADFAEFARRDRVHAGEVFQAIGLTRAAAQ